METELSSNKFYKYKGKLNLIKNIDDYLSHSNLKKIIICPYEVNTNGECPFLKFFLEKNMYSNSLSFIEIPIFENLDSEQLINLSKVCLFSYFTNLVYDDFNNLIDFNGFYLFQNNIYMFVDLTKCKIELNDVYTKSNNIWFAIMDEILNYQKVLNMRVDNFTVNFFINNDEFIYLLNENGESYEVPVVSYVGEEESKLNFTYIFGVSTKNKNAILGPYYYFTNLNNAFKEAAVLAKNKRNTSMIFKNNFDTPVKYGIVRFAIFTGTIKYIENHPEDPIDESAIKLEKLQDKDFEISKKEHLTMRITDYDGKWTEHYDSAYIGYLQLDDDSYLEKTHLLVIKKYEQQVPLSYHFIRNETVGEISNKNVEQTYSII